jgi:hypothetical protein
MFGLFTISSDVRLVGHREPVMNRVPSKSAIKFILSEDIRAEGNGKFSLLGVFPGERLAVTGEPPKEVPNAAFVLPSLSLVFVITDGEGTLQGSFRILGPDKKIVIAQSAANQTVEIKKGQPSVFASALRPFLGPSFGEYSIELLIERARFRFPFLIEKAPDQKKEEASQPTNARPRSKKAPRP